MLYLQFLPHCVILSIEPNIIKKETNKDYDFVPKLRRCFKESISDTEKSWIPPLISFLMGTGLVSNCTISNKVLSMYLRFDVIQERMHSSSAINVSHAHGFIARDNLKCD